MFHGRKVSVKERDASVVRGSSMMKKKNSKFWQELIYVSFHRLSQTTGPQQQAVL